MSTPSVSSLPEPRPATVDEVCRLLDPDQPSKPILWVGAGLSIGAGYPSTTAILATLERESGRSLSAAGDFTQVVDSFVAHEGLHRLDVLLADLFAQPRQPTTIHRDLAALARRGCFHAIVTTNYDRLLENALDSAGVSHVTRVLDGNVDVGTNHLGLYKIHGSQEDWRRAIFSGRSYQEFQERYARLAQLLDGVLGSHRVVFVGCSMQDPRLVEWLAGRDERTPGWFPLLVAAEWQAAVAAYDVLRGPTVQPLVAAGHTAWPALWRDVVSTLAPQEATALRLDLRVAASGWTVTVAGRSYAARDPMADADFERTLSRLQDLDDQPVATSDRGVPSAPQAVATLLDLARRVGDTLTRTLLDDAARTSLLTAIGHGRTGVPPRLHIVGRPDEESDAGRQRVAEALALPWELLRIEDEFPVREGWLDVSREVHVEGDTGLDEPVDELAVVATVAAPIDATTLNHEEECFRLWQVLGQEEHRLAVTDLGTLDETIAAMERSDRLAPVFHFTGHGAPGRFLFENETAESDWKPVDEVLGRMKSIGRLPRLIYLACCYGAGEHTGGSAPGPGIRSDRMVAPDLRQRPSPSTAAVLHRHGVQQVLGYFGPVGDLQSTAVSEAFYAALNDTGDAVQAVRRARLRGREPVAVNGRPSHVYPLGWAQLALYHRGAETRTTLPGTALDPGSRAPHARRVAAFERSTVEGLRLGFVGRRRTRSALLRLWKNGSRVLVVCGLGGLGKTAVCTEVLPILQRRTGEPPLKILALDGRKAKASAGDHSLVAALWRQVQAFREDAAWSEHLAVLQKGGLDGRALAAAVATLASLEGGLIVYLDDAESLQVELSEGGARLGQWRDEELTRWWAMLMELAGTGGRFGVVASSRYVPEGTPDEAVVHLDPLPKLDVVKMMSWFPVLARVPVEHHAWLADKVDGHPRTVEYLDGLVRLRERAVVGPGGQEYGGRDWRGEILEPALGHARKQIDANLLLDRLWDALDPAEQAQLARCCGVLGPVPWAALVSLDGGDHTHCETLARAGLLSPFAVGGANVEWAPHRLVVEAVSGRAALDLPPARRLLSQWFGGEFDRSPNARALFGAAEYALAAGDPEQAWPHVQRIAVVLRHVGRYREALEWVARADALHPEGAVRGLSWAFQVQLERHAGSVSKDAEKRLRAAEPMVGLQDRSFVIDELAKLFKDQGRLVEAAAAFDRSLRLEIEAKGTEEHADVAASLHALAAVLRAQGDLAGARTRLERSLAITSRVFATEDHSSVAASLHELAAVLVAEGDLEGARKHYERVIDIEHRVYKTTEHPSTAMTEVNLAVVLLKPGLLNKENGAKAIGLLLHARKVFLESLGPEHPQTVGVEKMLRQLAGAVRPQTPGTSVPADVGRIDGSPGGVRRLWSRVRRFFGRDN